MKSRDTEVALLRIQTDLVINIEVEKVLVSETDANGVHKVRAVPAGNTVVKPCLGLHKCGRLMR